MLASAGNEWRTGFRNAGLQLPVKHAREQPEVHPFQALRNTCQIKNPEVVSDFGVLSIEANEGLSNDLRFGQSGVADENDFNNRRFATIVLELECG